ncbi:MAG: glycosyltransferase [Bacteroidales bacterium]|jgi:glycosyltransferase involved in cell wall biosynthesis|nr:glycosyltransferase [Bacteroidales bacterium]
MLSILIPVFNYDCSDLISSLANQALSEQIPFEILVYDDCSTQRQELKSSIFALKELKYKEMPANLGRSKIRNLLAQEACYDNLLFLDCDSMPADNDFIKRYINSINTADCICGGTVYSPKTSIKKEQTLHWTYGTKREMRAKSKSESVFMANNFLIRRDIFAKVSFDTAIVGYGHEDTLFGFMLSQNGYRLGQIDNPVIHLGLHDSQSFLANTKNAAINLRLLYNNKEYQQSLSSIALVKAFQRIHKLRLDSLLRSLCKPLIPLLTWQLRSSKPSMFVLDVYKLLWFCCKKQ